MNKLIIVCGRPASGKSSYAKKLAGGNRAVLLDIDTCTEPIIQIALLEANRDSNDRDSKYFKNTYRAKIYETLFAIAKENIENNDVIIVGPFSQEIKDSNWLELLNEIFRTEIEIHYIYCDPQVRKERMTIRSNLRDNSKLEDWENYLQSCDVDHPPNFEHTFIDNS